MRPEPVTGVPQGCTAGAKAPRDPDSCSLQRIPAPALLLVRLARQASPQSQRAGAPGAAAHRLGDPLFGSVRCPHAVNYTEVRYKCRTGTPSLLSNHKPMLSSGAGAVPTGAEGLISGAKLVSTGTRALQEPRAQV